MKPPLKIVHMNIPGDTVGMSWGSCLIVLDPRQTEKNYLDTAIHETMHAAFPCMSEKRVEVSATMIADVLWRLGYRRKHPKNL